MAAPLPPLRSGNDSLEALRVKRPCPKSWAEMTGTDQRRFCEHCQLHVHNLSTMSPRQIRNLSQTPGRRCVAYFQTGDGTIRTLTRFAFLGKTFTRSRKLVASFLALFFPLSFVGCNSQNNPPNITASPGLPLPETPLADPLAISPAEPSPAATSALAFWRASDEMIMGDISMPAEEVTPPEPTPVPVETPEGWEAEKKPEAASFILPWQKPQVPLNMTPAPLIEIPQPSMVLGGALPRNYPKK